MDQRRYRVVQWATGHSGMQALRTMLGHPRLDVVGVYVYSDNKAGRDAGDLCDLGPTGIIATRDPVEVLATKPDCVVYMPLGDHILIDEMCQILESGANIVTSAALFHHPGSLDRGVRVRLEAACARGGTSVYDADGAEFVTGILPLAATMMQRRLDRYSVVQFADVSRRQSPGFLDAWFGGDPTAADLTRGAARLVAADGASLRQTADALSIPLDDLSTSTSVAVAATTTQVGTTTIEAGTVGAWCMEVTGLRGGHPLLSYSRTMYVTKELDPDWQVGDTGWRVIVEGDAPMNLTIRFPEPEIYHPISAGYNANVPVNCIPAVCEAPPGILTTGDLRHVPVFGLG